jgi:NADH:ubiquinone oxidoreductase subunit 6 (subunit J)
MKVLLLLASFLAGNFKNLFKAPGAALTRQFVLAFRALSVVILSSIGALAVFCSSLVMFISNLAAQLDQAGEVKATAGFILTLALALVALGVLIYNLREKTWLKATGFQFAEEPAPKTSGALETAIAALVMELISERKAARREEELKP